MGRQGNIGEALRAGLSRCRFGTLDAGQQLLYRKYEKEVDDAGNDEEVDAGSEEAAIFDWCSADVEYEGGEVRLTHERTDERTDDVINERFGNGRESSSDDDGDGQIDDVAAQNEIAKAFNHLGLRRTVFGVSESTTACEAGSAWDTKNNV